MLELKRVSRCPECGGKLTLHEFMVYSNDYTVLRTGELSKKSRKSKADSINSFTMSCSNCGKYWDEDSMTISEEGVFIKQEV